MFVCALLILAVAGNHLLHAEPIEIGLSSGRDRRSNSGLNITTLTKTQRKGNNLCPKLGGKCQTSDTYCDGTVLLGKPFCKNKKHFCCVHHEPTTLEPTTLKPTTPEPTTLKPTTPEPTTLKPTTPEPTTLKPTTPCPTAFEPTTTPIPVQTGCPEEDGYFHYPPGRYGQCFKYFADERRDYLAAKSKCQSVTVGEKNLELAHPFNPIGLRLYMMDRFGDEVPDKLRNFCWVAGLRTSNMYYRWPDNGAILSFDSPLWLIKPASSKYICMVLLMQSSLLIDKPQAPYGEFPCTYLMYTLCEYKP